MVSEIGALDKEVEILVAIDKLDKIGEDGVRKNLLEQGFSAEQVDRLFDMLNTGNIPNVEPEVMNLQSIQQMAHAMGVAPERVGIDYTLARGLDYYTGPVFETILTDDNIGSVSGGGRYDGLIGMFGKQQVPCSGCVTWTGALDHDYGRATDVVRCWLRKPMFGSRCSMRITRYKDLHNTHCKIAQELRNAVI